MATHSEMKIEKDEQEAPKGESDLDCVDKQVQNLFKFKSFYNHMDFGANQRSEVRKATIGLINSSGGSSVVQNRPHGGRRFEDSTTIFYEKDRKILLSHHNQPVYVIAYIHDVELSAHS